MNDNFAKDIVENIKGNAKFKANCPKCNKEFSFTLNDLDTVFTCPNCNEQIKLNSVNKRSDD